MGLLDGVTDSLGITQHGAKKAHKKQQKQLLALFQQLYGNQASLYGQAIGANKKALGAIQSGYGKALANSGMLATQAKQDAKAAGQQSQGAAMQSLLSRGLSNTTVLDNARRGIDADVTKNLGAINSSLAALQSGLYTGQAQAEAQQYDWLANLLQNQSSAYTGLGLNQASAMYGAPFNENTLAPGGVGQLASLASFFL